MAAPAERFSQSGGPTRLKRRSSTWSRRPFQYGRPPRPRLFLQAWAEHRIARDLAARRQLDAGTHRWATSALAVAAALAGAWIIYSVVPPLVTELNQRLIGLPTGVPHVKVPAKCLRCLM